MNRLYFLRPSLPLVLMATLVGCLEAMTGPDVPPVRLSAIAPHYPAEMVAAKLRGWVEVEFFIDQTGSVNDPHVIASSNPVFHAPALAAIRQWRFGPARKDGRPVGLVARQRMEFDPEGGALTPLKVPPAAEIAKLPPEYRYDSAPLIKVMPLPVYPYTDAREGKNGSATVRFLIDQSGRVANTEVLKATRPEFGQAVQAMLEVSEFAPAMQGTKPVPAMFTLSREFRHGDNLGDAPLTVSAWVLLAKLRKNDADIVPLSGLDTQPKAKSTVPPVFPRALLGKVESGEVVIEFYLDYNGTVILPRVVSATHEAFGFSAVQAVAQWAFEPPLRGGKSVFARLQVPLEFRGVPVAGAAKP